jgi:hypothetical protein
VGVFTSAYSGATLLFRLIKPVSQPDIPLSIAPLSTAGPGAGGVSPNGRSGEPVPIPPPSPPISCAGGVIPGRLEFIMLFIVMPSADPTVPMEDGRSGEPVPIPPGSPPISCGFDGNSLRVCSAKVPNFSATVLNFALKSISRNSCVRVQKITRSVLLMAFKLANYI